MCTNQSGRKVIVAMRTPSVVYLLAAVTAAIAAYYAPLAAAPMSCERLTSLALSNTTITVAETVTAGAFSPPGSRGGSAGADTNPFSTLPSFCRVAATLKPSSDSDIKIEVWMPSSGWNGKFQAVGNGGWSGNIVYGGLAAALRRGYATASTDTGHQGASAEFALGHPEQLIDFGYRAVHEMTGTAKAIANAFYDSQPRFSYWVGCSSGGKQGLKEAQRFPEDYDGIVAGAPANYWTHLMAGTLRPAHATLKDPASYIPREKYSLIHNAVMTECDARDGVKDGVLEDPARCGFDPKVLQCKGEDTTSCLTAPQVEAVRAIYAPSKNPRTGREIFPGLERGSEKGWAALAGGPNPFPIPADHFKFVVFKNPNWDFKTLDFDKDVELADQRDAGLINAIDPNLKPFVTRGGKLIIWHGWNDQLIAPRNAINYYKSVIPVLGGAAKTAESVRLFMAPGVNHCAGGDGPSSFDALAALEKWVEQGQAPDRIVASRLTNGIVDRTRPLCPYPQVAQYTGRGSADDESSFVCKAP